MVSTGDDRTHSNEAGEIPCACTSSRPCSHMTCPEARHRGRACERRAASLEHDRPWALIAGGADAPSFLRRIPPSQPELGGRRASDCRVARCLA